MNATGLEGGSRNAPTQARGSGRCQRWSEAISSRFISMQRLIHPQTSDAVPMHSDHTVDIEQLAGRYRRLSQELAVAYSGSVPWDIGRIDRLTHDLVATEREIRAATAKYRRHSP